MRHILGFSLGSLKRKWVKVKLEFYRMLGVDWDTLRWKIDKRDTERVVLGPRDKPAAALICKPELTDAALRAGINNRRKYLFISVDWLTHCSGPSLQSGKKQARTGKISPANTKASNCTIYFSIFPDKSSLVWTVSSKWCWRYFPVKWWYCEIQCIMKKFEMHVFR